MANMKAKAKNFVFSVCNAAFYDAEDNLICTGTANLSNALEVAMEEAAVQAGIGNKRLYMHKYGRTLDVTWQAQDWDLRYIAINTGSAIATGLRDVYSIDECVTVVNGIGTVKNVPVSDIAVKLPSGDIVMIPKNEDTPTIFDVTSYGITNTTVNATYAYGKTAEEIVIDSETSPMIGKLVLTAEKHSNQLGKIGEVQTIIPKYQASGNFTMDYTPDGALTTNIDGSALAYESDVCDNGNSLYAYIRQFDYTEQAVTVVGIAALPADVTVTAGQTVKIDVIGIKQSPYTNVKLDNADCTFASDTTGVATVGETTGVITGVTTGEAEITVDYNGTKDYVKVTVVEA